ncbi:outer membrane beta-barrel protein [Chryseobacterium arthrosphaerae]|uniref:outer membrane beta-barrel protein n=1 Tax=Chryseobacterium arthrosphaerae TaxID=651561 RepID=UPI001E48C01E|nr:outer membrane beta-barrel protein [Chryseobacterium arthrosphaerae]UEQ74928.1 outer membrane beta-barrel protein [Chryseobacterium arthrosphaerae]
MIKKLILMGLVCFFSASFHAQKTLNINLSSKKDTEVSPIVKEKVEEYAAKINAIIQEEKKLMEAELEVLKARNLDKADFDREKAQIADRYSEKMDKRIEELGFDLDDVIQKQVRYSLLNTDVTSNEELKEKLLKKFRPTRSFTGYFSYGIMTLTNNLSDNELDKNIGYANNLEFGLKLNYQLSRTSPWAVISGLGFSWRTIRADNNMFFTKDPGYGVALSQYNGNLDKSKLRTGYIMVPLGMQYNFSKLKNAGMDIQYRSYGRGFKIAANVYGGVKMSTNNIVKGNDGEIRDRGNYQVNPFVYGGQLTFSYNGFSLFVKKDFSNFFKDSYFKNDKALIFGLAIGLD